MSRRQSSLTMPANTVRRADRARKAKETINKTIPDILRASPRARNGVHQALLVTDPPRQADACQNPSNCRLRIRLRNTDSLNAARQLTHYSRRASIASPSTKTHANGKPYPNVCLLNMASPRRPGGGFLDGAISPEEFLCLRSTLYPSLWNDFYRLPDVGGVMTPDVLVFRDSSPDAEDLQKRDRFFVDVISASMIRFPGPNGSRIHREGEEDRGGCSCGVSYCDRDRDLVTRKMRAVLRMAQKQGAEKLVLGAWGCGAYGNPVREVAKLWKNVLCGSRQGSEDWAGINEVVFAISDRSMLRQFERCFADIIPRAAELSPPLVEEQFGSPERHQSDDFAEILAKIQETELELDQISNPRSRARLRETLATLNKQLVQIGNAAGTEDDLPPDGEDESGFVVDGFPSSDMDEDSYYNFDEDDVASSGSSSPTTTSVYEFKFRPDSGYAEHVDKQSATEDSGFGDAVSENSGAFDRGQLDHTSGWFSGSINGLSALLTKPARANGSPVLRPQSMGSDMQGMDLDEYLHRYAKQDN